MRTITITFRENPSRKEVETFFSCEPSPNSTDLENLLVSQKAPGLIECLKSGCTAIAVGDQNTSEEELRQKARVSADIQKAGQG